MIHDTSERWLQAFLEQPDLLLDELLCRYDQVAPYFGAEPSDVLVRIVRPRNDAALKDRVDQALADWLDRRMREPGPDDEDRNGYVQDILQALWAVLRLQARTAGDLLAERFEEATAWAEAVSPLDFYDLRAQLWLTLADVQPNRRLLSFWYGLCDQVGLGLLDERYLDIALIALRALPQTEGDVQPGPEVLRGLARWARHLPDRKEHRERFVAEWRVLVALYPRGPDFWLEQVTPLLDGNRGKPFVRWWAEEMGMAPGAARSLREPDRSETDIIVGKVRAASIGTVSSIVEDFATKHESYADATGTSYHLTCAFNRVGNALLNRNETSPSTRREHARLVLRLAGAAVSRARNDEQSWALWAQALERLGHRDLAETVLWEAAREFPDDAHTRCDLAALLIDQGRGAEAEALYRDTITRFPGNEVARNALARLLADHGQAEAAERLYRETIKTFPNDAICRDDLARLLKERGRTAEAEALYRQTMDRFPADAVCRLDLGLMLLDLGRPVAEVEPLLEELRGLRDNGDRTLADHLDAVKQGRPRPHRTEQTIPPAVLPTDEAAAWGDLRRSAEAMRAGFRLSKALDCPGLLLVTPAMRQQLRAEAEAALAALMKTHPRHPVVRLVARRYGGKTGLAAGIVPDKDDYALRLELARTGNSADFPDLLNRFKDYRPITALAWLLIDEQSTDAAAELLRWLPQDPKAITDPILHALHTRLHAIVDRRLSGMRVSEFLDIWCEEWVGPAESLNAVLDLTVFGLVARQPPYAALAWQPAPAA